MFGKTAIDGFSIITGYFMVKSNITVKKFKKTYLEVKFYYILFNKRIDIVRIKFTEKPIFAKIYKSNKIVYLEQKMKGLTVDE